jgi:hypothetical protein
MAFLGTSDLLYGSARVSAASGLERRLIMNARKGTESRQPTFDRSLLRP